MDIESAPLTYDSTSLKDCSINPRLGFIRKVYGIITAQLVFTVLVCWYAMFTFLDGFGAFIVQNEGILVAAIIVNFISMCVVFCCKNVARDVPTNYILLGIFTFTEAYSVAVICTIYQLQGMGDLVLMAAIMTAAMTFALTLYACTAKHDFTIYGGILFIISCAMLLLVIFSIFTQNLFLHALICALGVIFYGIYLIYDTQLIIGGGTYELTIDDYVIGAIIIYIDIIILFLRILRLLAIIFGKKN
eukprot:CAMPEP_0176446492 /NCGR_PEP_ID=MMETSP0127-20121128/24363_1 /TAXON_ID=938130 /ORGANISM="Platyophrya macrostoma, Strain WH" /LENGTH=245 /DNA_ID=CAMNT_0017832547 /DNA_START=24 /DNA_END=761 /DNA_ORIENTATION=-